MGTFKMYLARLGVMDGRKFVKKVEVRKKRRKILSVSALKLIVLNPSPYPIMKKEERLTEYGKG